MSSLGTPNTANPATAEGGIGRPGASGGNNVAANEEEGGGGGGGEKENIDIEVTDIADGPEARVLETALARLVGILVVLELVAAHPHVDGARLVRRQLLALLVDDDHFTVGPRLADRARMLHPLFGADPGAPALGGRVVLPQTSRPTIRSCASSSRPDTARRRAPSTATTTRRTSTAPRPVAAACG